MLSRRFYVRSEDDGLRVYSSRDDAKLRVRDVDEALRQFQRSPFVNVPSVNEAVLCAEPVESEASTEVAEFFEQFASAWMGAPASRYFSVRTTADGLRERALAQALSAKLELHRDVLRVATTMLASVPSPIVLSVGDAAARADSTPCELPIVPFGAGAIVGPFRMDGSPCADCMTHTWRMHDLEPPRVNGAFAPDLLAARILESLLSRPVIPYFTSYMVMHDALDDAATQNGFVRWPGCRACDRVHETYPPRLLRDNHAKAIASLQRRALLPGVTDR